jgi:hypothetical protein
MSTNGHAEKREALPPVKRIQVLLSDSDYASPSPLFHLRLVLENGVRIPISLTASGQRDFLKIAKANARHWGRAPRKKR